MSPIRRLLRKPMAIVMPSSSELPSSLTSEDDDGFGEPSVAKRIGEMGLPLGSGANKIGEVGLRGGFERGLGGT